MHFRHLWLSVGFSRWSRELTSHHPHFIFIGYKIPFFCLSRLARKALKPGQQCPVVCAEGSRVVAAQWLGVHTRNLFCATPVTPGCPSPELSMGLCLGRASPIKAFSWMKCDDAGKTCPALWSCFQLLYKEKIVSRAIHAEHSFFQNHKHWETPLLSPQFNFKNPGRIV